MSDSQEALPFRVAESITRGGTTFEVLEYAPLAGSEPLAVAVQVFTLNRAGVRLRPLRVRLTSDAIRTEPGALQFLKGRIPVPRAEIIELSLADETLQVDGSFALLRTGDVHFSVERASNTLAGAVTSGEGLLQTFRGTGTVWIAPTQPLYDRMRSTPGAAATSA